MQVSNKNDFTRKSETVHIAIITQEIMQGRLNVALLHFKVKILLPQNTISTYFAKL